MTCNSTDTGVDPSESPECGYLSRQMTGARSGMTFSLRNCGVICHRHRPGHTTKTRRPRSVATRRIDTIRSVSLETTTAASNRSFPDRVGGWPVLTYSNRTRRARGRFRGSSLYSSRCLAPNRWVAVCRREHALSGARYHSSCCERTLRVRAPRGRPARLGRRPEMDNPPEARNCSSGQDARAPGKTTPRQRTLSCCGWSARS